MERMFAFIQCLLLQAIVVRSMYVKLNNSAETDENGTISDEGMDRGSLLIKGRCNDPWGRICHYGDDMAAMKACQAMGYVDGGEWVKWSLYGSLKLYPIYWEKIECSESSSDLAHCNIYDLKTDTLIEGDNIWPNTDRNTTDMCGRGFPPFDTAGVRCFGPQRPSFGSDHSYKDDVHRIVELESVISNGSLTARFDIPEEHLLHVSPNANPVIVNHHYEEGGNCEWFNQPTSVRNCSESSTISWNRGRAGVSDDTVTVTLTIPYNASIAATKEWRIRANVPRHDCDLPLRYLLVIAPRVRPTPVTNVRGATVDNMVYTAVNISWVYESHYVDEFAVNVEFMYYNVISPLGNAYMLEWQYGYHRTSIYENRRFQAAVRVPGDKRHFVWHTHLTGGLTYEISVWAMSSTNTSVASEASPPTSVLHKTYPRPPLNIFAKMIGDTSATVTVTLPDQWKSYYDVVILTTYVMDLHTNTGRGIDTQRAVVSPWDIPQNKTFHVDGLELGMLFKFQAHLMVNGHPGIQSMYLYQYVAPPKLEDFRCNWRLSSAAWYCSFNNPLRHLWREGNTVILRGCDTSASGKCWPDIERSLTPADGNTNRSEIRLPLNLPAATWRFHGLISAGGEVNEPSNYATLNTSVRCVFPQDFHGYIDPYSTVPARQVFWGRLTFSSEERFSTICDAWYVESAPNGATGWKCTNGEWVMRTYCNRRPGASGTAGMNQMTIGYVTGSAVILVLACICLLFLIVYRRMRNRDQTSRVQYDKNNNCRVNIRRTKSDIFE